MTRVDVGDGKYTVVLHDNGATVALRYGEPWRDLTGDKLVYCLASELLKERTARVKLMSGLAHQMEQEWNPFEPQNQSDRYLRMETLTRQVIEGLE